MPGPRKFHFATGEFYHLYNRGTDKRQIFVEEDDYRRFVILLHLGNNPEAIHLSNYQGRTSVEFLQMRVLKRLVNIGAYCLMPNHFHLLAQETTEGGIGRFMQKLLTAYSMYFNKKYERSGNLFQGRFGAEHASSDRYLKYLFSYIHLNPVKLVEPTWREGGIKNKSRALKFLAAYPHSSYPEHCLGVERAESVILDRQTFPEYFQTPQELLDEIYSWLAAEISEVGP